MLAELIKGGTGSADTRKVPAVQQRSHLRGLFENDYALAASLFFLTFLSRIPFRTSFLYEWDSVLYARALDHFDVSLHQPQPPGYVFYVGSVWLAERLLGDPNTAMVWTSVLASAAAVTTLFWLGRIMFGRGAGLLAALLMATSLSYWVHGEVAVPYALLGFMGTGVAALIYMTWQGKKNYAVPAALALGLASGFRQDLLPFLLPLLAVGVAFVPVRRVAWAVLALAAGVLAWYVPSALLSGGFGSYQNASSTQSSNLIDRSSVIGSSGAVRALSTNFTTLAHFSFWALAGALPLLAAFVAAIGTGRIRVRDRRLIFLAVWTLPSILFYLLVHIGELGYVFNFLPAVLLAVSWGTVEVVAWLKERVGGGRLYIVFGSVPVLLILANTAMFLFLSPRLSARSLAARDEVLASTISSVRANFDPASTLIVAVHDDQHVSWYLPEYRHFPVDSMERGSSRNPVAPDVRSVILFDGYLAPSGGNLEEDLPLADGRSLRVLKRMPRDRFILLDNDRMTVGLGSE